MAKNIRKLITLIMVMAFCMSMIAVPVAATGTAPAETPAAVSAEAPAVETPAAPAAETPAAPAAETPAAPAAETPAAPAAETPVAPAAETPAAEPAVETPAAEPAAEPAAASFMMMSPGGDTNTDDENVIESNNDGSTGLTEEEIKANEAHADDRIYHVDARIDGTLEIQEAVDGELTGETKEYDIQITEVPTVTIKEQDGTTIEVNLSETATPDGGSGGGGGGNRPGTRPGTSTSEGNYEYMDEERNGDYEYGSTANVQATVKYTDDNNKEVTVELDYNELMTYVENECTKKDANDSQRGYDIVIEAQQLNNIITEKTTITLVKEWDTSGVEGVEIPETITLKTDSTVSDGNGGVVADGEITMSNATASVDSETGNTIYTYTISSVSKGEDVSITGEEISGYTKEDVTLTDDSGNEYTETRLYEADTDGNKTGLGYWVSSIVNDAKRIVNKWFNWAVPEPEPTDPDPTDPDPTDPEPTDPDPTDPDPTDPDPTDPDPTDPDPTDPDPTDPEPTDPDPTDPEPTDPDPTDPDPTDPDPTDPEPTDPDPTDPDPTDPEPAPASDPGFIVFNDDFVIDDGDLDADELEIKDEEVPLAKAPITGDISLLWAAISGLSASGMFLLGKKRKDEE